MSVAAAWLWVNAQQINEFDGLSLWQLNRRYAAVELGTNLGCQHYTEMATTIWCVTSTSIWVATSLGQQHYVRKFKKEQQPQRVERHPWFGLEVGHQYIDSFTVVTYSSDYSADALVRGFRFRNSSRIEFFREIEHGRYHLVTHSPKADIFVVAQGNSTYTFVVRAKRAEHH
ncbi:hypothetical protein [Pseudidiomarina donghaiensis]|uniref:Uncharacterized protein n=1 Tax=Pseudidiomarina donghaiensis TaxID=519452 RepID=A0A432XBH0_9GAMM|nr:hypothetical protein [Pseudidiomarina donghaiensis]RUO46045.1 hypothetical protein CWE24_12170 [Pseudidiomarina donghaiensis]SFV25019.1 hypothetical protein SAMN04488139_0033 [Pseudidiomarina donghaiensis]